MTALAGPKDSPRISDEAVPDRLSYPIAANTFVHQGGMVALNASGQCVPAGTAGSGNAIGVALDDCDNLTVDAAVTGNSGLAGCINVEIQRGAFPMVNSSGNDAQGMAQAILAAHVTLPCYVVDDQTVALTDNGGLRKFAGFIIGPNVAGANGGPNFPDGSADGRVYAQIGSDFVHPGVNPSNTVGMLSLSIPLAGLPVGGGIAAAITPGFAGRILRSSFSTTQPGTGAGATIALSLKIGGVAVTGGGTTATIGNQTQGAEAQGAAITALNSFTALQQLTVVGAAGTVFTAGELNVNLWLG